MIAFELDRMQICDKGCVGNYERKFKERYLYIIP
jgi:hypothetical protein